MWKMQGKLEMTDEFKAKLDRIQREVEKASAEANKMEFEKQQNDAEEFFRNLIAGVAYKFDVAKDKLEKFTQYLSNVLVEQVRNGNFTRESIHDYAQIVRRCNETAKKWQYDQDFSALVKEEK